jgi:uncharacterized protein
MATPSAGSPRILLLLGGTWHDFDGFGRAFQEVFPNTEITHDLEALTRLTREETDVVVMFTCLTPENEDGSPAAALTDGHALLLAEWVSTGGALLGVHGATVSGKTSPEFRRLIGGVFVEHPEAFEFAVRPVSTSSLAGLETFTVHDEFYLERCEGDVTVRMVGIHEDDSHPLVWTREEGCGRVAHIAMGHDGKVWNHPAYRRLLEVMLGWLFERPGG